MEGPMTKKYRDIPLPPGFPQELLLKADEMARLFRTSRDAFELEIRPHLPGVKIGRWTLWYWPQVELYLRRRFGLPAEPAESRSTLDAAFKLPAEITPISRRRKAA